MAKVFNSFEKIAIKNAAKAVAAIQTKQEKLRKSIELFRDKVNAEIAAHDEEIKVFEDSVKGITGGYSPTELCRKEVREGGKQSDWVFVYPETIVPPISPILDEMPVEHPETEEEAAAITQPEVVGEVPYPQEETTIAEDWEELTPDPMDDIFKD